MARGTSEGIGNEYWTDGTAVTGTNDFTKTQTPALPSNRLMENNLKERESPYPTQQLLGNVKGTYP